MDDAWHLLQGVGVVLLFIMVVVIGLFASPRTEDGAAFGDDAS